MNPKIRFSLQYPASKKMFLIKIFLSKRKDDIKTVVDKLDSKYGVRITGPMYKDQTFMKWGNRHNAVILTIPEGDADLYYVNYDNIKESNKRIKNFLEKSTKKDQKAK